MDNYFNRNENNVYSHAEFQRSLDQHVSSVMKGVYLKMTFGLVVTALVSLFCANSYAYLNFMMQNTWAMWVIFGIQFVMVIAISGAINKLSSPVAALMFYIYAILMGLWMAPLFWVYTGDSIAKTFFITAGTFGAMTVYGYCTSQNLAKFGSILMMCLFGLIICVIVNLFLKSSSLDWIISAAGVLIFIGLTAWDTQQIKQMAATAPGAGDGRLSTLGALSLYLDFINLFLFLLRFFGGNRD